MLDAQTDGYSRPPTTQSAVAGELRRRLLSGQLKPGDRVLQDVVAQELHTSVVPVREALKTLESEGQLTHIPNRGFFVAELSRDELLELCDIRSALESMAVERTLVYVSAVDLKAMADLVLAMEAADRDDNIVEMVRLDRQFHFQLFEAQGKNQLTRIIATTWDQSDPYRAAFFNDPEHRATNHSEHRRIIDAIKAGESTQVIELLDAHRLSPVTMLPGSDA